VVFTVIDLVGTIVFGLARAITAWKRRPKDGFAGDRPGTILVIQLDHLGDAIITLPMLQILRRHFPKASIEVLAAPCNKEWFEAVSEVDRVHVCRANRFTRRWGFGWILSIPWWGWYLRRRHIDLGIDVRGEFPHAVMLWLSGARRRLGWNAGGGGFLLTHSPSFVPHRPEHLSRIALLETLGIRPGEINTPVFSPNERARQEVRQRLARVRSHGPREAPLFVFHIGAGTAAKRWPVEHWRELIGRLVVHHGAEIVLVGIREDRIIARRILGSRSWPGVTDWTDRLKLEELAALVEQADLLVGGDSAPVHLASAVGTAAVVLFSGTNCPRQWQPHGRQVTVVRQPVGCSPCHREVCPLAAHPCMRGLEPMSVLRGIVAAPGREGVRI
jgi:heptosyltransferase-2